MHSPFLTLVLKQHITLLKVSAVDDVLFSLPSGLYQTGPAVDLTQKLQGKSRQEYVIPNIMSFALTFNVTVLQYCLSHAFVEVRCQCQQLKMPVPLPQLQMT
jgi:hypothetical protein